MLRMEQNVRFVKHHEFQLSLNVMSILDKDSYQYFHCSDSFYSYGALQKTTGVGSGYLNCCKNYQALTLHQNKRMAKWNFPLFKRHAVVTSS